MVIKLCDKLKAIFSRGGGFLKSNSFNEPPLRFNGASAFDYSFMMSLDEKDYKKYLSQAYWFKFMKKPNLKHPKTINEKIQWLKLNDNIPIKTQLTDKVLVRDWIKDKIGSEYLKPVLWIGKNFDDIPFEDLPDSFVIKANHACSWNIFIKNKQKYLNNKKLFDYSKEQIDGWLRQNYFGWSDFETQYKNIEPQIIIEQFLSESSDRTLREFEIWCFNSKPRIFQSHYTDLNSHERIVSIYDESFKNINLKFLPNNTIKFEEADDILRKAVELSKVLAEGFKLVRIDWIVYKHQLYFGEMTFTPQSGYFLFSSEYKEWYLKLGNMINLKGNRYGRK